MWHRSCISIGWKEDQSSESDCPWLLQEVLTLHRTRFEHGFFGPFDRYGLKGFNEGAA